jgi:hypothetical protein
VRRALAIAAVMLACAFTPARPALADPPPGDGAPPGMVAFFDGTACPDGWTLAGYAQGRLILGVTSGVFVGAQVGVPLAPEEDRTHAHAFSTMIALAVKSISAAGGSSSPAAAAQSYSIKGTTGQAPSGLPFIELRACERKP